MKAAVVVVGLMVMGSGIGVVYVKHQCRQLFMELQALQETRDSLEVEWEMLQLEQGTLTTESIVDHTARTRLRMIVPGRDNVVYVVQ